MERTVGRRFELTKSGQVQYVEVIYFQHIQVFPNIETMKSRTVDNRNVLNSYDRDSRLKKILRGLSAEDGKYICRLIYSDPLAGIYWILLIIYIFILSGFLLWPFDFAFDIKNDARWIRSSKGIEFVETGQAVSNFTNQKFFNRLGGCPTIHDYKKIVPLKTEVG